MVRRNIVRLTIGGVAYLLATVATSTGLASAAVVSNVTFCHSTSSTTNAYNQITTSTSGVINGHAKHARDIIPPFTYTDQGVTKQFAGLNWTTTGQAIFNNGCVDPGGGMGGGGSGGGSSGGTVLGASTNASSQSSQVSQTPQGGVSAGEGGGSIAYSSASLTGMIGSLAAVTGGLVWLNLRKQAGVR